jgi:hypothetical protein
VFGVSWEAGISVHRWLAYLFLGLTCIHAGSWYVFYAKRGWFPHDVYAVELDNTKWPSDFSVPLISLVFLIVVVCMGVLALDFFRRKHFEVPICAPKTLVSLYPQHI